jgi:hypothetical protein
MLNIPRSSRQPHRAPWTIERLVRERAIALGSVLDPSTQHTYSSHLQSYLSFIKSHNFPLDPTPDTLSFFTVFMSAHIDPQSVGNYLTGICHNLEHLYPNVRQARNSPLVSRTLAGCRKRFGSNVIRKPPLAPEHLITVSAATSPSSHDDLLFCALMFCGFFGLHRLGELVWPDRLALRSWRKVIRRRSVTIHSQSFSYLLPTHKSDHLFEGNTIVFATRPDAFDPSAPFFRYLASRDQLFPLQPALWLTSASTVPTRTWFMRHLHATLPSTVSGHSLCSGGATFFAAAGWPDDRIQALGRWTSDSFKIYIRKNPIFLQALLHSQTISTRMSA